MRRVWVCDADGRLGRDLMRLARATRLVECGRARWVGSNVIQLLDRRLDLERTAIDPPEEWSRRILLWWRDGQPMLSGRYAAETLRDLGWHVPGSLLPPAAARDGGAVQGRRLARATWRGRRGIIVLRLPRKEIAQLRAICFRRRVGCRRLQCVSCVACGRRRECEERSPHARARRMRRRAAEERMAAERRAAEERRRRWAREYCRLERARRGSDPHRVTQPQRAEIWRLFGRCGMIGPAIPALLAAWYGVNAVEKLSRRQARDLIARLRGAAPRTTSIPFGAV